MEENISEGGKFEVVGRRRFWLGGRGYAVKLDGAGGVMAEGVFVFGR